jgi:hypothetical protein
VERKRIDTKLVGVDPAAGHSTDGIHHRAFGKVALHHHAIAAQLQCLTQHRSSFALEDEQRAQVRAERMGLLYQR